MWKNILGTVGARYLVALLNIFPLQILKPHTTSPKTSVALKAAKNSLNDIVVYL